MLNMDNFAFSGGGDTSAYGPTRNPHNPDHLAGGSSGRFGVQRCTMTTSTSLLAETREARSAFLRRGVVSSV